MVPAEFRAVVERVHRRNSAAPTLSRWGGRRSPFAPARQLTTRTTNLMDSITQRTHPFQYWLLLVVAAGILCIFVSKLLIAASIGRLVAVAVGLSKAAHAIHGLLYRSVICLWLVFPL